MMATWNKMNRKHLSLAVGIIAVLTSLFIYTEVSYFSSKSTDKPAESIQVKKNSFETVHSKSNDKTNSKPTERSTDGQSVKANNSNNQTNLITNLLTAFKEDDEFARQDIIRQLTRCGECFEELNDLAADPTNDLQLRIAAAKALLLFQDRKGPESFVGAMLTADTLGDDMFVSELLAIIHSADTPSSTEAFLDIIFDKTFISIPFEEYPGKIQYALKKNLRLSGGNKESTAVMIDYFNAADSEEDKWSILTEMGNPVFLAAQIIESYEKDQTEHAKTLLSILGALESDRNVIDGYLMIAREATVWFEESADGLREWVIQNESDENYSYLESVLNDPGNYTPEERMFAAYGYSTHKDIDWAKFVISEAKNDEVDEPTRKYFDDLLKDLDKNNKKES